MASLVRQRLTGVTLGLVGQFLSIAAGVYLGMQADDWKEARAHRELARATLESIRAEALANRAQVVGRLPYHTKLHDALDRVAGQPLSGLRALNASVPFSGTRAVTFAHTAYDLALGSQALTYVPRETALAISGVYLQQAEFQRIEDGFLQQLLSATAWKDANAGSLVIAMDFYMGDVMYQEPTLLKRYDRLVPLIDSTLRAGFR